MSTNYYFDHYPETRPPHGLPDGFQSAPTSSGSIPRVARVSHAPAAQTNVQSWVSQSQLSPHLNSLGPNSYYQSPLPPHSETPDHGLPPPIAPWTRASSTNADIHLPPASAPGTPYPTGPRPMPPRGYSHSRPPTESRIQEEQPESAFSSDSREEEDPRYQGQGGQYQRNEIARSDASHRVTEIEVEEQMTIPDNMTAEAHHDSGQYVWTLGDNAMNPSPQSKGKGKGFVGGFVAGLKKFPNMLGKRGTKDVLVSDPRIVQDPPSDLSPTIPPWLSNAAQQHDSMPVPRFTPPEGSGIPSETTSPMTGSSNPQLHAPQPIQPPQQLATLDHPQDPLPNPHAQVIATPPPMNSPVQMELQPTEDYGQMSSGGGYTADYSGDYTPGESSSGQSINIGKALNGLRRLPWMSTRIAADYKPSSSTRAKFDKPVGSWYTKPNPERVDLLETNVIRRASPPPTRPREHRRRDRDPPDSETSSQPRSSSSHRPREHRHGHAHNHHRKDKEHNTRSEGGATAVRPTRTPASATSGGVLPTSPGASSHGLASHSHSTNYYYSPTQATPPAQYILYPSNMIPQPVGQVPAGTGSDSSPGMQPQMQPMPIYMVAAPQYVMPSSSPPPSGRRHHRSHHHSDMPRPHHSGKSPRNPP
ncbi:hypothetical protein NLI96_g8761 [Meripilus lineatus]|uniref:Uncharacterized protein n=1 Tax=Meripilus lineatus TaxID=2056292 RepID=A0AAD5UYD4_9APHY|nr:hypothetical protein NLI96_g8761 [Physisporinus lineatus]